MKLLKSVMPFVGVFGLALLVRIIYNLTVAQNYAPIYDAGLYHILAQNLVHEHCYCLHSTLPDMSRPPLWPFVLAIVYAITGDNSWHGRLFYCFLGSGTCVLICLFARDLFNRQIAWVTGVIAALYYGLFIYDGWLYTETLYTFLLISFTYAICKLQKTLSLTKQFKEQRGVRGFWHRHTWAITSGILLGLITLTRPNGVGFFGLLIIWAIFVVRKYALSWRLVGKELLLVACLAVLFIAPWTYRNYRVSHAFVLVSMGMGEVLSGSYNDVVVSGDPTVRGFWRPPPHSLNHDSATYTLKDDSADTARALIWIRSHLSSIPYLLGLHLLNMWTPYTYSHGLPMEEFPNQLSSQILWKLIPVMSLPVFFCAVAGLIATLRSRWSQLVVVYLVLAFTIGENIVFYADMRFRAPIEPLLVLLTGGLLWWLTRVWPILLQRMEHSFTFPKLDAMR